MQCWQCGRTMRQGAKLCIYCGAKLEDEEQAPRASGARGGRRGSAQGGSRSSASRGDLDDRGDAPPYGDSEEYDAHKLPDDRDDRYARRPRAPSTPRDDDDYSDRGASPPRPRESRLRDPLDDPRAPIGRGRGTPPPPGRERREPNRYGAQDEVLADGGDGSRRGARDHAPEERPRRGAPPARDDEWGGGEQRSPRSSRREGRDDRPGHDNGRDNGRDFGRAAPPSASSSRRRSDMEYGGGYEARGGRDDGYDERHERGASRERRPSRGPQLERDWERGDPRGDVRGGYRGDVRGGPYPQPPLDDSWGMPAVGGGLADGWGLAPSEELSTPVAARGGRNARGRSGPAGRGGGQDRGGKAKSGGGSRVAVTLVLVLVVIGLIGAGVLVAPKVLSRFGGAKGSSYDTQPPFTAYTPGPTPTAPPNYARYVSTQLRFAVDYPKAWTVGPPSADSGQTDFVVTLTQPSPQAAVLVEQSTGFDTVGNDEMIHDEVLASQNAGSTFTETTSAPTHALIGGEQWLRRDYDVVPKGGAKVHMAILSCHHQGHGYVIVLVSLPQNFAHDDQTTFQSILVTFRFLA